MPKPIENNSKYIRITVYSEIQRNHFIWNQKIKDRLTFKHNSSPVIAFRGHCCRLQGCLWTKHPWKSSVIRVGGNLRECFSCKKKFWWQRPPCQHWRGTRGERCARSCHHSTSHLWIWSTKNISLAIKTGHCDDCCFLYRPLILSNLHHHQTYLQIC